MEKVDHLFELRRKGLGDLQGVDETFLFAEKGIQRFRNLIFALSNAAVSRDSEIKKLR